MELFKKYNEYLDQENEIRERIRDVVRELENEVKQATYQMQGIHLSLENIGSCCMEARKSFQKSRDLYEKLSKIIPANEYYRFSDHWNLTTQKVVSLIALVVYLEAGFLVTFETCAEILGLETKQGDHFFLDIDAYLQGVLQMVSELSRFAVNSVTLGDYSRVLSLQKFVSDVNSGFRMLNMKNDGMRKRFDSLKYDVKKIESIIYDLSIRGLINKLEE